MLFSFSAEQWNLTVYGFEIVALIIAICMIIVGMVQEKKAQTGLQALNGGNDELFMNTKERGLDKTLSKAMMYLGIAMFCVTIIISIFTNIYLV